MRTTAASIFLACAFCLNLVAFDSGLENALTKKYDKTILILRRPVAGERQKYNANGELLKGGPNSAWTVDGAIEVRKVRLTDGELSIEGRRRVYGFDARYNRLLPFKMKEKDKPKVKLEIALDTPLSSLDQADAIIHRIFASNEQELISSAPDFWRPFLIKQYGSPKVPSSSQPLSESTHSTPPTANGDSEPQPAKVDNKTVKRPEPVFTPEPSFSDAARNLRYQGTMVLNVIINKEGKVQGAQIIRPLGLGLDEEAVAAVRTWRFRPATRNGEPVVVELAVEVAFHLF